MKDMKKGGKGLHGDTSHNHGVVRDGDIVTPYGRDNSSHVGKASDEREGTTGGGATSLGHSFSGGKVKTL